MFTNELDDNRTHQQKKRDLERTQPQQMEMFSQRDIAQFGVNPRPLLPLSPHTKLGLMFEDPRTDEEIERDRQREAERRTRPIFDAGRLEIPSRDCLAVVVYQAPCLALTVIEKPCLAVAVLGDAR